MGDMLQAVYVFMGVGMFGCGLIGAGLGFIAGLAYGMRNACKYVKIG